jgi:hypothetical protein
MAVVIAAAFYVSESLFFRALFLASPLTLYGILYFLFKRDKDFRKPSFEMVLGIQSIGFTYMQRCLSAEGKVVVWSEKRFHLVDKQWDPDCGREFGDWLVVGVIDKADNRIPVFRILIRRSRDRQSFKDRINSAISEFKVSRLIDTDTLDVLSR